jgi:hypothetical protein
LNNPLFIAEIKAAPRAMDSLEFKVLEGSIPKTEDTVLMKLGIREPPPNSSMLEILTFIKESLALI